MLLSPAVYNRVADGSLTSARTRRDDTMAAECASGLAVNGPGVCTVGVVSTASARSAAGLRVFVRHNAPRTQGRSVVGADRPTGQAV
jgi:hypothetical protein